MPFLTLSPPSPAGPQPRRRRLHWPDFALGLHHLPRRIHHRPRVHVSCVSAARRRLRRCSRVVRRARAPRRPAEPGLAAWDPPVPATCACHPRLPFAVDSIKLLTGTAWLHPIWGLGRHCMGGIFSPDGALKRGPGCMYVYARLSGAWTFIYFCHAQRAGPMTRIRLCRTSARLSGITKAAPCSPEAGAALRHCSRLLLLACSSFQGHAACSRAETDGDRTEGVSEAARKSRKDTPRGRWGASRLACVHYLMMALAVHGERKGAFHMRAGNCGRRGHAKSDRGGQYGVSRRCVRDRGASQAGPTPRSRNVRLCVQR